MVAAQSRLPTRTARSFTCPHCDALGTQRWQPLGHHVLRLGEDWPQGGWSFHPLREGSSDDEFLDDDAEERRENERTHGWVDDSCWASTRCGACEMITIWRDEEMIYPRSKGAPASHPDMPLAAAELYAEARAVLPVSRRAGTAMARATLERLLRDLDPDAPRKARLDQRIERVTDRVSSGLGGILDVIRYAGNKSMHVESDVDDILVLVLDEEDVQVVELLFSAINELVDELVTKPKRHSDLINRLPESFRDGIMQRRGGAKG